MVLLSLYGIRIGYNMESCAIMERCVALPVKILAKPDTQKRPVCKHVDLLLDTGEPKGHKDKPECTVPQRLHVTAYFDGACW